MTRNEVKKKDGKLKYQKPQLMRLFGSEDTASGASCGPGNSAVPNCTLGTSAKNSCASGTGFIP